MMNTSGPLRDLLDAVRDGKPFRRGNLGDLKKQASLPGGAVLEAMEVAANLPRPIVCIQGLSFDGDIDLSYYDWRGRLELSDCSVSGDLNLYSTKFRGVLNLNGSSLNRIDARYAQIEGALILNRGFTAECGIRALGLKVTGGVSLINARLGADPNLAGVAALDIYRASIGDLFLNDSEINGGVYAVGAVFERSVRLQGAKIRSRSSIGLVQHPEAGDGLDFAGSTIGASLFVHNDKLGPVQLDGSLRLVNAHVRNLLIRDDEIRDLKSDISGLTYERLGNSVRARELLTKIDRDPLSVQSYRHLADSGEVASDPALRRRVLISLQDRITEATPILSSEGMRRRLFSIFARYGYAPGLSFLWLMLSIGLSILILRYHGGFMKRRSDLAQSIQSWDQSAAFSLDSFLPFSFLGVAPLWTALPESSADWIWLILLTITKVASWGFAVLALASITRLVRRAE